MTTKAAINKYFLFVDIETTGLIKAKKYDIDLCKPEQFPHIVQMSWQLHEFDVTKQQYTLLRDNDYIVQPTPAYIIPEESTKIHGISHEQAMTSGVPLKTVLTLFIADIFSNADSKMHLVCHNIEFDVTILLHHIYMHFPDQFTALKDTKIPCICTMLDTIDLCALSMPAPTTQAQALAGTTTTKKRSSSYKFPKLSELYYTLFNEAPKGQLHNSKYDVIFTVTCFKELWKRRGILTLRYPLLTVFTTTK